MEDLTMNFNRFYLAKDPFSNEVKHIFTSWKDFKKHLFSQNPPLDAKVLDVVILDFSRMRDGIKEVFSPPHKIVYKQSFFDFK